MEEIWKDVLGYEGFYMVSNLGRVKSLPRNGTIKKEKILTPSVDTYGYPQLTLRKKGFKKTFKVHRIVMLSFVENEFNKPTVNHKNGIKIDNRLENLEWNTVSENVKHAFQTGLKKINQETLKINRINFEKVLERKRIKVRIYDLEGNIIGDFKSYTEAENHLGLKLHTIKRWVKYKCKNIE